MRALLFLLPIVVAGCGSTSSYSLSQREILKRSQVEIARREPWAGNAVVIVENADDYTRMSWKVRAGAFDDSDYPSYKGIYFVQGTERELRFNLDGCLTSYTDPVRRCPTASTMQQEEMLMVPMK